ncbi:MAG: replication protein [Blastocatellia bacterium]|nr:replication protein [Blastocatellia bacterium]
MRRGSKNQQNSKRIPTPKKRREPLPVSISVKHHLPVSAEGTATDLTVAELEAASRLPIEEKLPSDYSTSRVIDPAKVKEVSSPKTPLLGKSEGDALSFKGYQLFLLENEALKADLTDLQLKKQKRRRDEIAEIDLNVDSKFVKVPNAIADKLARQLSPAEEKIFDQIWRLTVGFNREVWRGKISDLMLRTGYSSRATVTKAIAGLSALNLITVEGRDTNPRGRSYRIADRAQLLDYLGKQEKLDHSIKKSTTTHAKSSRVVEQSKIDLEPDPFENTGVTTSQNTTSRAFKDNFDKKNDDSVYTPSSSSWDGSTSDDEKASQVRLIYQDLSGNSWGRLDESVYREVSETPLPFIILGICYSITRAAEHRIGSFKYCIPSIKEHYDIMRGFNHNDLVEIAYRHLVRVKEAQRTGLWTISTP